jgi:hypothetical protein
MLKGKVLLIQDTPRQAMYAYPNPDPGAITITYSECVCVYVALVIKHAKCICRIILSSVAYLAVQNFSTLSHKRHDFRKKKKKKVIEHKVCFDFLCNILSKTFLILKRIQ